MHTIKKKAAVCFNSSSKDNKNKNKNKNKNNNNNNFIKGKNRCAFKLGKYYFSL